MPRFFIEIVGADAAPDLDGQYYGCLADARADGIRFLADFLEHHCTGVGPGDEWELVIRDENVRSVFVARLSLL